jgi:DNA-binding MarR family transcriptional regulator
MTGMEETIEQNSKLYSRLLISRARDMTLNARQKDLAPFHISSRQAYILKVLFTLGNKATLSELAKHNEREINTLSVQMSKMVEEGLVKKTRQTPKSTLLTFELTDKGMEAYQSTSKMKTDKAIMASLTEEERQELIRLLEKVIKKAEKYQ